MAKQKKFKEIPDFKNEDEERKFWSTHIKQMANFKDVPYQSLIKIFLAERVEQELRKRT